MKDLTALVVIIACVTGTRLHAQTVASTPKSVAAAPKGKPAVSWIVFVHSLSRRAWLQPSPVHDAGPST